MVMAKGIADGFPLSATIARPEIADALRPGEHLSTFGGNPVSCAAAIANIDVMLDEKDRKSTRLNSSHANISYAVFCLKTKIRSLSTNARTLLKAGRRNDIR